MGINYTTFEHLAMLSKTYSPPGETLMLGRQKFDMRVHRVLSRRKYSKVLKNCSIKKNIRDFYQNDQYSEKLFEELGFSPVLSLDASGYENADIIWDLNTPIVEFLEKRFGLIVDGGTLEHVFDVKQAMDNVARMMAPGGKFVSFTPFNGYPGHGFYQFSPEVVWSFWAGTKGFNVNSCYIASPDGRFRRQLTDTRKTRSRIQYYTNLLSRNKLPSGRLLMCYEVEKPMIALDSKLTNTFQSDYEKRWN